MSEHEQPEQLSREDLRALSPREVRDALHEGRLVALLAGRAPEPQAPPVDLDRIERAAREGWLSAELERLRSWQPTERERLAAMTPEAVRDALRAGELDALMRGEE